MNGTHVRILICPEHNSCCLFKGYIDFTKDVIMQQLRATL